MIPMAAAACGAILAAGIVMAVLYFRAPTEAPKQRRRVRPSIGARWSRAQRRTKTLVVVGVAAGLIGALLSGIVLLVVVIPAAVIGLPILLGRPDTREKDLILALETWSRSLASTAETGNFTLREVIGVTRGSAPAVLSAPVDRLYARMSAAWSPADALLEFAEEMNSSYVDEVVIYLIQAATFNSGGLSRALSGVADTLAGQAKLRMDVFNEREKPRRTMQVMTGIIAVVLAAIVLFSHTSQISFYATPLGEIVLAIILGIFAAILVWARSKTRTRPEARIILSSSGGPR